MTTATAVVAELRADVTTRRRQRAYERVGGGRPPAARDGRHAVYAGRPNCCRVGPDGAIVRYDPETGEDLEEYCSTSDAARKLSLRGRRSHRGSGTTEDADGPSSATGQCPG